MSGPTRPPAQFIQRAFKKRTMAFGAKKPAPGRASPERPPNASSVDSFGPGLGRLLNSRIAAKPRASTSALLTTDSSRPTTAYGRAARNMSPITAHPATAVPPVSKSVFFAASPPPRPLFGGSSSSPSLTLTYAPPPATQPAFISPPRFNTDTHVPPTPQMLLPSSVLSPAPPKPLSLPTFTPYAFCKLQSSWCFTRAPIHPPMYVTIPVPDIMKKSLNSKASSTLPTSATTPSSSLLSQVRHLQSMFA